MYRAAHHQGSWEERAAFARVLLEARVVAVSLEAHRSLAPVPALAQASPAPPVVVPGTLGGEVVPWATIWINEERSARTPTLGRPVPERQRLLPRNAMAERSITATARSAKTTAIHESLEGTP